MAKYTTELNDIIKSGLNLFEFEYTFYDQDKKEELETRFTRHFYFREIGTETVGRFIHNLEVKFNEVLPFYNELFKASLIEYEILNNYDMIEAYQKTTANNRDLQETADQTGKSATVANSTGGRSSNLNSTNTRTEGTLEKIDTEKESTLQIDGKNVSSDTPNGLLSIGDIKGDLYASSANIEDTTNVTADTGTAETDRKTNTAETGTTSDTETNTLKNEAEGNLSSTGNRVQAETTEGNENYTLTRTGNIGVMHAVDMVEKHIALQRKLKTVYAQFFNECEDLFMQIF